MTTTKMKIEIRKAGPGVWEIYIQNDRSAATMQFTSKKAAEAFALKVWGKK